MADFCPPVETGTMSRSVRIGKEEKKEEVVVVVVVSEDKEKKVVRVYTRVHAASSVFFPTFFSLSLSFLHFGDVEHSLSYDNRSSFTSGNEDKKMTRACINLCPYTHT